MIIRKTNSLENRWGRAVALRLDESLRDVPFDTASRLTFARERALAHRKKPVVRVNHAGSATISLGLFGSEMMGKLCGAFILLIFLTGLFFVEEMQSSARYSELAGIDMLILTDELPPSAYLDSAFVIFLESH